MSGRRVLSVSGADAQRFLHDLVTNDVEGMGEGPVYAALLTPQGKYLFDFFVLRDGDGFWLDVAADQADPLAQRLLMYRLRAKVAISETAVRVVAGTGAKPAIGKVFDDPRDTGLGWRAYLEPGLPDLPQTDMTALRVRLGVPETGIELIPDETYILEAGFERLNGVSFRKGCFVGQEVTARMKHKTELRKGLVRVRLTNPVPVGTPVTADGQEIGTLYSNEEGFGLAQLRLDRVRPGMRAGWATADVDPVQAGHDA